MYRPQTTCRIDQMIVAPPRDCLRSKVTIAGYYMLQHGLDVVSSRSCHPDMKRGCSIFREHRGPKRGERDLGW